MKVVSDDDDTMSYFSKLAEDEVILSLGKYLEHLGN